MKGALALAPTVYFLFECFGGQTGDAIEVRLAPECLGGHRAAENVIGAWTVPDDLARYCSLIWPEVDGGAVRASCVLLEEAARRGNLRATAAFPLVPGRHGQPAAARIAVSLRSSSARAPKL